MEAGAVKSDDRLTMRRLGVPVLNQAGLVSVLPPRVRWKARDLYDLSKRPGLARTRRAFESAGAEPEFLSLELLEELAAVYPGPPEYGYSDEAVLVRGRERAAQILGLPGGGSDSFLEIGCADAMAACALARSGKRVAGIDLSSANFDPRAISAGVELIEMDAAELAFPDASFEFVYSYNSFEHLPRPDLAMAEMLRVLRPGGHLFVEFGPLYFSPFGAHAYRSIPVPYCHLLWPLEMLNEYERRRGREPTDFGDVNGWRISQFRSLFGERDEFQVVAKRELLVLDHLDLVRRFPSCFATKTRDFEDLLVGSLQLLGRRKVTA